MNTISSNYNFIGILDNKYNLIEKLDFGSTCNVYKVMDNKTKEIKVAKIYSEEKTNDFQKELDMINSISDLPLIIKFFASGEGPLHIKEKETEETVIRKYIILEYAKGSLFKFIKALNSGLSEDSCKYIFNQLILAIKAIHEKGICHRDIKLENALLVGDEFSFRLCDFGLSTSFLDKDNKKIKLRDKVGSPFHFAPEILRGRDYDGEKIDVFCAGVSLICLLTGKIGFFEASRFDDFYKLIITKKTEDYWDIVDKDNKLSKQVKELYIKMVAYNPKDRPTINEILNSEWLSDLRNANEEKLLYYKKKMIDELNNIKV